MEFTNASKIAIGTLLLGTFGYLGKQYFLGYQISDLIKQYNPERKLISSTISLYSEKWKDAWKRYLQDNKGKNKDAWEIPDWNINLVSSKQNEAVPTSFIDACDRFSETNVVSPSNSIYQEVLKWCTISATQKISELIKEKGKRIFSKFDSGVNFESRKALIEYLKVKGNPLGIEGIEKNLNEEDLTKGIRAFDSFVNKCNELGEKIEGVKDSDISKVLSYCSLDRTVKDLIADEYPNRGFIDVSKIKPRSLIGMELWNKYFNSNKDKEEDDWNIGQWSNKKLGNKIFAPEDFFKNCGVKSARVALNIEPKIINELIKYCTFDKAVQAMYDEAPELP